MDEMSIDGDENVQIRAEGDVVSAVGDGAIAAQGNITINNYKGIDPEKYAQALLQIKILEEELRRYNKEDPGRQDRIYDDGDELYFIDPFRNVLDDEPKLDKTYEKLVESVKILEEMVDVEYPIPHLLKIGQANIKTGDYGKARKYFIAAIEKAEQEGNKVLESWGYNALGCLAESRGELEPAKRCFSRVETSDSIAEAAKLGNQGILECRRGNYTTGEILFHDALYLYELKNDIHGIANTLNSLGNVVKHNLDYEYALHLFYRSKNLKLQIGDIYGVCNSMQNIAIVHRRLGRNEEALVIYSECLRITEENDWIPFSSDLHNNIGNVFLDMGDYEKAGFHYQKSLEINLQIGNAVGIGLCKQNLGSLAIKKNDLDAAEKLLMESKRILKKHNSEHLHGTLKGLEMIRELRRI